MHSGGLAEAPRRRDRTERGRGALVEAHRADWAFVVAATVRAARDLDLAEECVQEAYAARCRAGRETACRQSGGLADHHRKVGGAWTPSARPDVPI